MDGDATVPPVGLGCLARTPTDHFDFAVANRSPISDGAFSIHAMSAGGLFQDDDVRNWLLAWSTMGYRCALITVVGVEGGAPRTVGAQMAVSETGHYAGYLSGGCLELAVAHEALGVMRSGRNRRVRYGAGSPYIDIRLPCGSSIDVYFDQSLDLSLIRRLAELRDTRAACVLRTDIELGQSTIADIVRPLVVQESWLDGSIFNRTYLPPLNLQLIGAGPSVTAIARLAATAGLMVQVASPCEATRNILDDVGLKSEPMSRPSLPASMSQDPWTAVVLAFHDHVWEPPILKEVLAGPCFYVGAIGSRNVHAERLKTLAEDGVAEAGLKRLYGQVGLVPGAKSSATLAVGVIAEIVGLAKSQGLVM
ncbi:MAG: XdhC family protein [Hyphomicrobiaceae bacterium]